jgi:beta-lactamase regulating signal transducer with metallopeptidase domain
MQRLRWRRAKAAPAAWQRRARRLAASLGVHPAAPLLASRAVDVPMVIGWIRPVILLPAAALAGLGPAALEAVLVHELEHIRRRDYLVNLLQSLAEVLLFYHPAVWWVSRQVRLEREHCCDDAAVTHCGDPLLYARALTSLEELRHSPEPRPALALAATGGILTPSLPR